MIKAIDADNTLRNNYFSSEPWNISKPSRRKK